MGAAPGMARRSSITAGDSTNSPDLRESSLALSFEAFRVLLREGALASAGMPKYDDLNDADLRALHAYIRQGARAALSASRAIRGAHE